MREAWLRFWMWAHARWIEHRRWKKYVRIGDNWIAIDPRYYFESPQFWRQVRALRRLADA